MVGFLFKLLLYNLQSTYPNKHCSSTTAQLPALNRSIRLHHTQLVVLMTHTNTATNTLKNKAIAMMQCAVGKSPPSEHIICSILAHSYKLSRFVCPAAFSQRGSLITHTESTSWWIGNLDIILSQLANTPVETHIHAPTHTHTHTHTLMNKLSLCISNLFKNKYTFTWVKFFIYLPQVLHLQLLRWEINYILALDFRHDAARIPF